MKRAGVERKIRRSRQRINLRNTVDRADEYRESGKRHVLQTSVGGDDVRSLWIFGAA